MDFNYFIPFSEENEQKFLKDEKSRKQIIDNSHIFSINEEGSRIIQKIYNDYPKDREAIFNKIYPNILDISKSEKGNYCKKIIPFIFLIKYFRYIKIRIFSPNNH